MKVPVLPDAALLFWGGMNIGLSELWWGRVEAMLALILGLAHTLLDESVLLVTELCIVMRMVEVRWVLFVNCYVSPVLIFTRGNSQQDCALL